MQFWVTIDPSVDGEETVKAFSKLVNLAKKSAVTVEEMPVSTGKLPPLDEKAKGKKATTKDKPKKKKGRGPAKGPTQAKVKDALKEYKNKHGRDAAKAILAEYDVEKVSELEKEHYQAVIDACSKEPVADDSDDDDDEDDFEFAEDDDDDDDEEEE
jgi:hypothetical protein